MIDDSVAQKAIQGTATPHERETLAAAALHRQQRRIPAIVRYDAFNMIKWIALGGTVVGSALLMMWWQDLSENRQPLTWRYHAVETATVEFLSPSDGSGPREVARDDLRTTLPQAAYVTTFGEMFPPDCDDERSQNQTTALDAQITQRISRSFFSPWRTMTLDFRWADGRHIRTQFRFKCEKWRPPSPR